jgi:hypothetical protein
VILDYVRLEVYLHDDIEPDKQAVDESALEEGLGEPCIQLFLTPENIAQTLHTIPKPTITAKDSRARAIGY